jgi:hypothetical protein
VLAAVVAAALAMPSGAAAQPSSASLNGAPMDQNQTIGTATMSDDGTIVMDLRATSPGALGDGRILYKPDSPHYQEILRHLGGLNPGETKFVRPFPN